MGSQKRAKFESLISLSRQRSIQVFSGLLFLYLIFITFEIPMVLKAGLGLESPEAESSLPLMSQPTLGAQNDNQLPTREKDGHVFRTRDRKMGEFKKVSGLVFDEEAFNSVSKDEFSELHKVVRDAFVSGNKVLEALESGNVADRDTEDWTARKADELPCPSSVVVNGTEFLSKGKMMVIPCGLSLGSHITIVGRPRVGHLVNSSNIAFAKKGGTAAVSQFKMELQGLRAVDGEDPPRILHFNPRLKGDWSGRPVIEQNTCYRMHWGSAQRCEGWKSRADVETVDGHVKCEKWIRDNDNGSEESKTTWWLKRLVGKAKKVTLDWPFPFAENKLFVLMLNSGLEGFHINVDGRHISSFPYRLGFTLEDATGLYVNGDVDIHSIVATSLPLSHPRTAPLKHLEFSPKWKAPSLPAEPVELFIGILSAGNHFAERMAVRKSWMQYKTVQSANVVARFFVAMHTRTEVNAEVMKEAEYFGDIVIVPYMDNYDLVVLKTIAICEYGIRTVGAKYIMKCDDDTFVKIDAVMIEVFRIQSGRSFYVGNINYYHKPLRRGKWAVTYEEWPEEVYPPYANGPGYIVSSDIAHYAVSEFEKHKLRLFKMEDVSMGMWVEQFNRSRPVEYVHSFKFCQFGCIEGYITAHYQSPRQMICLWEKLVAHREPQCCNMR